MTTPQLSLCTSCNCMTKTINGKCGKCGETKPQQEDWEKEFDNMFLEITQQQGHVVWKDYRYATAHACIKQFLEDELATERQKLIEEVRVVVGENELTHTESNEIPGAIDFNAKAWGRNEMRIKIRKALTKLQEDTDPNELTKDVEKRFNKLFENEWDTVSNDKMKSFISQELTTAREQGAKEERKESGLPLKNYYEVAQHLRQFGRDNFMSADETACGFYEAIKEIDRYFRVAEPLTDTPEQPTQEIEPLSLGGFLSSYDNRKIEPEIEKIQIKINEVIEITNKIIRSQNGE